MSTLLPNTNTMHYGTMHHFPTPPPGRKPGSRSRTLRRTVTGLLFVTAALLLLRYARHFRVASIQKTAWNNDLQLLFQSTELSEESCHAEFPGLFAEIESSAEHASISRDGLRRAAEELEENGQEYVSAMVFDNELRILHPQDANDLSAQLLSTLRSLHISTASSSTALPNTAFIISQSSTSSSSVWSFTRSTGGNTTWLIPSSRDPRTGTSYSTAVEASESVDREYAWKSERSTGGPYTLRLKLEELFWEGEESSESSAFLAATKDQPWAMVRVGGVSPLSEQCRYKFLAYTRSNDSPLRFSQTCTAVLFAPASGAVEHNTAAVLVADGEKQNYVAVREDWSDVEEKVSYMREHPQEAEAIARRGWTAARRYSSAAADSCYWRELLQAWGRVAEVSEEAEGTAWQKFIMGDDE